MSRIRKVALATDKGQVNLGTYFANKYFDIKLNEDGTVLLTPVPVLTVEQVMELAPELAERFERAGEE